MLLVVKQKKRRHNWTSCSCKIFGRSTSTLNLLLTTSQKTKAKTHPLLDVPRIKHSSYRWIDEPVERPRFFPFFPLFSSRASFAISFLSVSSLLCLAAQKKKSTRAARWNKSLYLAVQGPQRCIWPVDLCWQICPSFCSIRWSELCTGIFFASDPPP